MAEEDRKGDGTDEIRTALLQYRTLHRPGGAVALLQAGEAAGFESAWTIEHTVVPKGYRSSYPYAAGGRMPGDEAEFVMPTR